MKKSKRYRCRTLIICICIAALAVLVINISVVSVADKLIITPEKAQALSLENGKFDCIMVLGASVSQYGPSAILANRLDTGLDLFGRGVSDIVLLSGDNGTVEYNEVQAMKDYMLKQGGEAGLEPANIYLDYAGFSTYSSAVRSKDIFGAKRIIIVTQRYHLYRALFIAKMIGLDAYGVAAEDIPNGQALRDAREVPARVKDFFLSLIRYTPSVMGDPVPLKYPSTQ